VSNLIELKQIPVTIRAFEKIHQKYPQARLTIIGRGPDRAVLEKLCDDLKIADVVTFMGQVQHQEVLAHMSKSQFYIMPSVREGLPISYLEAMSMGCVVVGTATEGIAEIIDHGKNGFLVQPGDYESIANDVCACIDDPVKACTIAQEGNKTAQLLTWQHNAQKLVELFEKLQKKD
jgi:glycosyltransferase involved in cell wall biosynthesis